MLIVVDEEIADARTIFGRFGEVRLAAGRGLAAADVADADALIVRSVTRVDASLLAGSRVRFVGTATSGADHIDTAWLAASGITFADAAGCNSVAVAEYVFTAIFVLARRLGFDPRCRTLGIVGVGRIGSIVARWGEALGMRVLKCDPPLRRQAPTGRCDYVDLPRLAAEADIVTLHVPLTRHASDATCGMVDEAWLGLLRDNAVLINTSRGEVVHEDALLAAIESRRIGPVVLDVWCREPDINGGLASRATLATPHIAGYSVESRRRAVRMIADALGRFASQCPPNRAGFREAGVGPEREALQHRAGFCEAGAAHEPIATAVSVQEPWWIAAAEIMATACNIESADLDLRTALRSQRAARGFDDIRRRFSARQEWGAYRLVQPVAPPAAASFLRAVGFG